MKRAVILSIAVILLGLLLITGCRPPEVEGVVVDIQNGMYDKAFELAKEAVQKYPNNAEAWYWLGYLYGRQEDFVKMNEAFDKSLALSQQFAQQIEQARFSYFANNFNDALNNYYKPARAAKDPKKKKELYKKAAEKFLKSFQAYPTHDEPLTPLAVSLIQIGDTVKAEQYLDKAIEMDPKNDTLMVTVGDFYYRIGKLDKAKELYQRALQANPKNVNAHLAMGEIYTKEEKWDEAVKELNTAAELAPDNPTIPMNIGIIYYNNEKYQEAIPFLKKSLSMDPNNKDMTELLSICYLQTKQYDQALPFLEEAVKKFPDSALLWNNLGVVYAQKGMKEKAEEAFNKQKQLENQN